MTKSPVLSFHTSTQSAWDAMIETCNTATASIEMEEFVFEPDPIGERFCNIFIERAKKGVKVRLLLDWWGCKKFINSRQHKQLINCGIEVRFFREPEVKWLYKKPRLLPRDHRKILIVDQKTAYTGGVCVKQAYKDWRDTMVAVSGTLVEQLSHVFERTWLKTKKEEESIEAHPDFSGSDEFSIFANAPDSNETNYSDLLIQKIEAAESSIKLTTPYFTPDYKLLDPLHNAIDRGVDVQIILSDYSKYAPYVVGKRLCGSLIQAGATIYYYQPSMLHLKTMIIDNKWAALGSCNLDGLSLYQNQEVMLTSTEHNFIEKMVSDFNNDKSMSQRMGNDEWLNRPSSEKLAGLLLSPFRWWI